MLSTVQKQLREEGSPGLLDQHGLLLLLLGRDHHPHLQAQEPAGQEGGEVAHLEASAELKTIVS